MKILSKSRKQVWTARVNSGRKGVLASNSGLTLLETIVALAILTIGIVGVLHAFSTSMAAVGAAESYSNASLLANQVASELDRQTDIEPGQLSGTFEDAPGYSWEADVQPADENGLMRTAILVTWYAGKMERNFDMVIYLRPDNGSTEQQDSGEITSPPGEN